MAYMQHDCFGMIGTSTAPASRHVVAPVLTLLERQVVAIAEREPLSSLATGKRPVTHVVFGVEPARALADPRLEALRRFVVLHRHGDRRSRAGGEALVSLGFPPRLLTEVRARVAVRQTTWLPSLLGIAAIAMLVAAVVAVVANYLGELLPAAAVGLALCLPIMTGLHGIVVPSARTRSQRTAA